MKAVEISFGHVPGEWAAAFQTMKMYRSKIDLWLIALLGGVTTLLAWSVWQSGHLLALIAMTIWFAILALAIFPCSYTLTDDHLLIRTGVRKRRIAYADIRSVRRSGSILAAPALSLKRVEIRFGRSDAAILSPADREQFMEDVRQRVPEHARAHAPATATDK